MDDMKPKTKKAWISPVGKPVWTTDHIEGATKLLKKSFRGDISKAYEEMFAHGWVRMQIDRYDVFFNMDHKKPNRNQFNWLKDFAAMNRMSLVNGDTNREITEDSDRTEEEIAEAFSENDGNAEFLDRIGEEVRRSKVDQNGRKWVYNDSEGSWRHGEHVIGSGAKNGSKWQVWDGPQRGHWEYDSLTKAMNNIPAKSNFDRTIEKHRP